MFEKVKSFKASANAGSKKLPAGGYVCRIKGVKEDEYGRIIVAFDIDDGGYAGFFTDKYRADRERDAANAKWKGTYRMYQTERDSDEASKALKSFAGSLQDSNEGFEWDTENGAAIDPYVFKGLRIGILFREDEFNGYRFTKAFATRGVDSILAGDYSIPEFKPKEEEPTAGFYEDKSSDEDDLPF